MLNCFTRMWRQPFENGGKKKQCFSQHSLRITIVSLFMNPKTQHNLEIPAPQ
jgi:hypothetical protein